MPSAGAVYVDVLPDTRFFGMALRTSMNRAVSGSTLTQVGKIATRGLVVGLAAAGAASVKMALDFNQSFTRIDALTNASDADIRKYKDSVMELAGETAQSPRALAEALYFLASAGLRNNEILPALEATAKGAAIGLGEAADVSRILVSALNAYADSGLTAIQVTDTLAAGVREGSAAPEEFAVALGRILPVASAAKVEFDEVVASLSTLSNIGLNVYEGTTAMRGVLQSIVAPTKTASAALAEMGLSGEVLRRVLAEGGLLEAMRLLEKRSGGNLDIMKAIIPNVRALVGELGNVGQAADKVSGIYRRVGNAIGTTNEAMRVTENSPAFQFRKALNELSIVMLDFGTRIMPSVVAAMKSLAPVAEVVAENIGVIVGAFLAFKSLSWLPPFLIAIEGAIGALALGLSGLAGPLTILPQLLEDNAHALDVTFGDGKAVSDLDNAKHSANLLVEAFKQGKIDLTDFGSGMSDLLNRSGDMTKNFHEWAAAQRDLVGNNLINSLVGDNEAWSLAEHRILAYVEGQREAVRIGGMYKEFQEGMATTLQRTTSRQKEQTTATKAMVTYARQIVDTFGAQTGKQLDLGVLGRRSTAQILDEISASWHGFAAEVAGSIGNIFTAFDALSDKKAVSFEQVANSIRKGIAQVKEFGRNLRKIGEDARAGIPGAQDLLQHLIELGPEAGSKMANAIANATPKARRALERDIGGALKSVQGTANSLTGAILGGMNRVAAAILVATGRATSFQAALAQIHDVTVGVNLHTDAAYANLNAFLAWGNSQSIVMDVYTALHGRPRASGGPVEPNNVYVVGERGPEMFVPRMSGKIVPHNQVGNWGRRNSGGGGGSLVMVKGTLSIDAKGQAFIRGLAREEINDDMAYRRL